MVLISSATWKSLINSPLLNLIVAEWWELWQLLTDINVVFNLICLREALIADYKYLNSFKQINIKNNKLNKLLCNK